MALNRWSLDRIVAWVGSLALIALFVPVGTFFALHVVSAAERSLADHGLWMATSVARQVVKPLLVEDDLGLYESLRRAASADSEVRYLCVENARKEVVAHTFKDGYPTALGELWKGNSGQVVRFRTQDEPLVDISVPILAGQLGTLHVGMSRAEAIGSMRRVLWAMGGALGVALSIVFLGARVVASRVSQPLRELEAEVSQFPGQATPGIRRRISGTPEVESLARGFADMTERLKALERERAATHQHMVQAERLAALGELAAGLAHEVHNPLDGMQECLRYLSADPDKGERAAKYYPMLQEGLERIAEVMRGMLTFARSGQKVSLEPCPSASVVESLELLVQNHLRGRKVRLTWQNPGGCVCLCDRQGLEQAALNLVLNAAEAAEGSDDPEVRIEATCDAQWVYLSVEDSGPGVAEELREHVFDPFFTTKPAGKGTGLGLSVSRQLIRAAGGEVELGPEGSRLGGARFVIRMPRAGSVE